LQETGASWAPMVDTLRNDAAIREHYQFWFFSYPSGYPYPYSAALLRRDLAGIRRAFPNHKRVVLIGHSMGGMICRLMVTDAVDKLPITRRIPYHSIMGDRGGGDTPNSSDGVVPYWSSHLDGAQSELIVNSDHGAQSNPDAIREVERILKTYP